MSTVITRKLEFDAGHRVLGHESKCAHLHGHRYVAEVSVTADELDGISRVIDFGVVKQIVGGWVDENWDHNILLNSNDPLLYAMVGVQHQTTERKLSEPVVQTFGAAMAKARRGDVGVEFTSTPIFGDKLPWVVPDGENPTAEVMAKLLFHHSVRLLLTHPISVTGIRIYETPNCWADYTPDEPVTPSRG